MIPLLGRVVLVLVGSWWMGRVFQQWLIKPSANPTQIKRAGIALLCLNVTTTFQYFNISIPIKTKVPELAWWVFRPFSVAVLVCLGFLVLVGVVRVIGYLKTTRQVPAQLITPWLLYLYTNNNIIDEYTQGIILNSRDQIEAELREASGNPRLIFRWVERCQLPFTAGFLRPMVCCPVWISQVSEGGFLMVLLQHEAEHVSLRHHQLAYILGLIQSLLPWTHGLVDAVLRAMELEVDRRVVAASSDHGELYRQALSEVVQHAQEAVASGVGHDPRHLESRLHQMGSSPVGAGWHGAVALTVAISMLATSLSLGRPDIGDLIRVALREQGPDLQVMVGDPKLHVFRLPGRGGALGDGIGVDARGIAAPVVVVEYVRQGSFEFTGAAEMVIRYRAMGPGPFKPLALVNAMSAPSHAPIPGSSAISQTILTVDADVGQLSPGSGELRLHLQGDPGAQLEFSGPRFSVPKGWAVEISRADLLPASRLDPLRIQVQRRKTTTLWQGLNGIGGSSRASSVNLAWTPERGLVGF